MENVEEQELQVKRDLANLIQALTPNNINIDVMFARTRGIRAVHPPVRDNIEIQCLGQ